MSKTMFNRNKEKKIISLRICDFNKLSYIDRKVSKAKILSQLYSQHRLTYFRHMGDENLSGI